MTRTEQDLAKARERIRTLERELEEADEALVEVKAEKAQLQRQLRELQPRREAEDWVND